jgi:hypothetical protein
VENRDLDAGKAAVGKPAPLSLGPGLKKSVYLNYKS